jgi:hypothetical protein
VVYRNFRDPPTTEGWSRSTELGKPAHGLRVARTLLPERSSDVSVRVLNVLWRPEKIETGVTLSDLQLVEMTSTVGEEIVDVTHLDGLADCADESVTNEQRRKLSEVLLDLADMFSRNE